MNRLFKFTLGLLLVLFSVKTLADPLPIGLSLNMSTSGAQFDLDFKNGVDAYFQALNKSKRFGKYKLQLIAMDDAGVKERAVSNTKRLIKSKKVLALLSSHGGKTQEALVRVATKNETLLLSSSASQVEVPSYAKKYIGYLTKDYVKHLDKNAALIQQAEQILILSDDEAVQTKIGEKVSSMAAENTLTLPLNMAYLNDVNKDLSTLFFISQNFIASSINLARLSQAGFTSARFIVLPDVGATLTANALKERLTEAQLSDIYYLNAVPLHLHQLPLIKRFKEELHAFNPKASKSHQALKGYLLAHLLAEGIYKGIKGIDTESLTDLVTLPFQILDKVVGWVSYAGADVSKSMVVDSLLRVNNFDAGLSQVVNIGKQRIAIEDSWLSKANTRAVFSAISVSDTQTFGVPTNAK